MYTVTQIVSNTVGTYTSQLRVEILGTPEITFETDGGSDVPMQTVRLGQRVTVPDTPVKEGFDFGGWFTDSACTDRYDFNNGVTGHTTLYAKWAPVSDEGEVEPDEEAVAIHFDWRILMLVIGGIVVIAVMRRR